MEITVTVSRNSELEQITFQIVETNDKDEEVANTTAVLGYHAPLYDLFSKMSDEEVEEYLLNQMQ